jgi:hypothetical protein
MSRSIRNSAFSRRRRDNSASASVASRRGAAAAAGESRPPARLTQLVSVLGGIAEAARRLGDAAAVTDDQLDRLLAKLLV